MVLFVVLLQINFLQRKQSREANVTSHAFQQVSNLDFFLNASAGHSKRCGGPQHAARKPVVGPHWLNQTTLMQSSFYALHGFLCMQACGNMHKV